MSTSSPTPEQILVAVQSHDALVRVLGRATFKISAALKQFGQSAIEGGCRRFLLDMEDCAGMDSTMMGVLAGLASRVRREGGEMVMIHLNARTRGLVATLGLDHIVAAFESGQTPDAYQALADAARRMRTLEPVQENKQQTARTMLEAHEQLVQLDPSNQPRFKDVLTYLREDLRPGR